MHLRFQLPAVFNRARRRQGFTLVEVMFTSACAAIILTAVLSTFFFLLRAFAATSNNNEIHRRLGKTLAQFSKDMREANNVGSLTSTYLQVTVPTNFTNSGTVSGTKTITYSYNNSALYRTDSLLGTPSLQAANVYSLTFSLYDANNVLLAPNVLSGAKSVQLNLDLRTNVLGKVNEEIRSTRVLMRNIP
jgi:prepilin-type N-terminal cleavage/methylation domain-containing protein